MQLSQIGMREHFFRYSLWSYACTDIVKQSIKVHWSLLFNLIVACDVPLSIQPREKAISGMIRDVLLFDRALTDEEVLSIFQNTTP